MAELPIHLDRGNARPLHVQLADALREAVTSGLLAPGERLPSTRELARTHGVSRIVATEAFQQLYTEGWLEGRHGSGTYVTTSVPRLPPRESVAHEEASAAATTLGASGTSGTPVRPASPAASVSSTTAPTTTAAIALPATDAAPPDVIDLRPGRPWVADIDAAAWRRAWRHAGTRPPRDAVNPFGRPELRDALVDHLRRARGVAVDPANLLVTRGTSNAVDLIAATLLAPGDRVGVEEPCFPNFRHILAARGAHVVPCPVDGDGLIPDRLPDGLRLIHTTPAHQYPLGGRMPVGRRATLLDWARRTGALVLEDDYDTEYRYDVAPLPPLYALGPDRVLLLGSLSKTLTADVGVGWIAAEPEVLERVARRRVELSDRTSGPVQDAVAFLARRGDLERHLRRMRAEYARRRAQVVRTLGSVVPLRGDSAGLQVVAELPAADAEAAAERAARRGVLVPTLEPHHHGEPLVTGLLIGYGSASLTQVKRGCAVLREVIVGARGGE